VRHWSTFLTRLIVNREPVGPVGWGNFLTKLWGEVFPVEPIKIATEYTRGRFGAACIGEVVPCPRELVEGMLTRRKQNLHWTLLYAEYPELPGRQRFTIAHELGHYLLHRERSSEFKCMDEDVVDHALKQLELEANEFASYLLMPMDDFRTQVQRQLFSLDLLGHCANRYGTTFLASALKWIEFTGDLATLVVARDGFVLWSRPSQSARKKHLFFGAGREVPNAALISQVSADNLCPAPRSHAPGVWMPYAATTEYAVLSDRYALQIAVLRFEPVTGPDRSDNDEGTVDLVDRMQAPRW
jgi:hypothetical protein